MEGEWLPPEGCGITGPPANNNVIGHVIHRLFDIARPSTVSLSDLLFYFELFNKIYCRCINEYNLISVNDLKDFNKN